VLSSPKISIDASNSIFLALALPFTVGSGKGKMDPVF
jgi:hypothetical protein